MSTLEKFGILVILILVVVIGVVAVWGVGGENGQSPFDAPFDDTELADVPDPQPQPVVEPAPVWPDVTPPVQEDPQPVAPPPVVQDDPRPAPAPAPAPVQRTRTYTVRSGDTLATIARRHGVTDWTDIVDANPGLDPRAMRIGTVLVLPGAGVEAPRVADDTPRRTPAPRAFHAGPNPDDGPTESIERTYTIRAGDTLSKIAETELGKSALWNKILEANEGLDPRRLRPGQKIRLPAAE